MMEVLGGLLSVFAAIAALVFLIWLVFIVPRDMAKARGRDPVAWVLVSLLGSPFLAIFVLWLVGTATRERY